MFVVAVLFREMRAIQVGLEPTSLRKSLDIDNALSIRLLDPEQGRFLTVILSPFVLFVSKWFPVASMSAAHELRCMLKARYESGSKCRRSRRKAALAGSCARSLRTQLVEACG